MIRRAVCRAHAGHRRGPGNARQNPWVGRLRPAGLRAVLLLISFAVPVYGSYVAYDFRELMDSSPRIVTAELIGTGQLKVSGSGGTRRIGVLSIESNLKGPGDPSVVFLALPDSTPGVATSGVTYDVGQRGLWFLRRPDGRDDELYLADHPQRFKPLPEATETVERTRRRLAASP